MSDSGRFPQSTDSYLEVLGVCASVGDVELTAAWRACSRRWHPDRFALSDPETRETAEWAASLANDAYRALANPFDRAGYLLLRHRGVRADALKGSAPAGLFAEMLEIQEVVEDALESADHCAAVDVLGRTKASLDERVRGLSERLQAAFHDVDNGAMESGLDAMQQVMAIHGYLRRASETVERALESLTRA